MATLDMVGLVVRDMAAALRYYRLLGLEIAPGQEQHEHVAITLPGGMRLAWDSEAMMRSIHPEWARPATPQPGLAFLCESPAEVDALYATLVEAGYSGEKAPWDAFWGQRYAVVQDPDGHLTDLFAPLPGQG
jgi:uncharacterized glyoxalase superfamily protein PhnB